MDNPINDYIEVSAMRYRSASKLLRKWVDRLTEEEVKEILLETIVEQTLIDYRHIERDEIFVALLELQICETLEEFKH